MNNQELNKKVLDKLGWKVSYYNPTDGTQPYLVHTSGNRIVGELWHTEDDLWNKLSQEYNYSTDVNLALTLLKGLDFYLVVDEGGCHLRIYADTMPFGLNHISETDKLAELICRVWLMYKNYVGDEIE